MHTDRNLLFGVLALQADLIDDAQFTRACSEWAGHKQISLAELLVEHGWLTPSDRADVEKLLERKLSKHQGDARASLAAAIPEPVRHTLAGLMDADIRQSVADLAPPPQGPVLVSTIGYQPATYDRYTLSRLHATGGIGRVWLARDVNLGRDVALKELRPERAGSKAVGARFLMLFSLLTGLFGVFWVVYGFAVERTEFSRLGVAFLVSGAPYPLLRRAFQENTKSFASAHRSERILITSLRVLALLGLAFALHLVISFWVWAWAGNTTVAIAIALADSGIVLIGLIGLMCMIYLRVTRSHSGIRQPSAERAEEID